MTTSVAMCTYNGSRFIKEQLNSIIHQTINIDEIVICDDISTDETTQIIKSIAQESKVPISIYVNEQHLGCIKNFEKAIKLCKGDIIFLSDQDDIWMNNKVEKILAWFKDHPNRTAVFGDAVLINQHGGLILKSQFNNVCYNNEKLPVFLWEDSGFTKRSQRQFDKGFGLELWCQMNRATGATMAFRKELVTIFNQDYNQFIYHDSIISLSALLKNQLGYIQEPLIQYRQHTSQAIGCHLNVIKSNTWDDARCPSESWTDFSLFKLSRRDKCRILFCKKRINFKYSFLGWRVFLNLFGYLRCYHIYWVIFFIYDMRVALEHTIYRIKRKIKGL